MRFKLSTILMTAFISCPVVSFAMENVPKYCPGVEAIKNNAYTRAQVDYWVGWIALTPNSKYDTEEEWTTAMMVGSPKELSEDEAVKKANQLLPLMQMSSDVPEKQSGGYWCFYADNREEPTAMAYSFTPAYKGLGEMLAKMRKLK